MSGYFHRSYGGDYAVWVVLLGGPCDGRGMGVRSVWPTVQADEDIDETWPVIKLHEYTRRRVRHSDYDGEFICWAHVNVTEEQVHDALRRHLGVKN